MKILKTGIRFNKIVFNLISSYSFLTLSLIGNSLIIAVSLVFFRIEAEINPNVNTLMDAIWWGYATATTVGYGDIIPISHLGKLVGIFLMLIGTSLFATFTALFAKSILEDELFLISDKTIKNSDEELLLDLIAHKKILERQINYLKSK